MKEFDAFISHASEDKLELVRPLAQKIQDYGAKIWYDEFSLKPGVSLSRSIEKGLSNSKYGLVILSEAFFKKSWTEYELRALNSYEVKNPGIIIPVWYNVTEDSVRDFSPYLSDKLAIVCTGKTINQISIEVLEAIREDLFEEILRKKAWDDLVKSGNLNTLTPDEAKKIEFGPIRHDRLPNDLVTRIRIIRVALFDVYTHSFEYWMEGFQRDMHPENEIRFWERLATCYLETKIVLNLTDEKKQMAYNLAFSLLNGYKPNDIETNELTDNEKETVVNICSHPVPYYDIKDKKFSDK